jgi:hypothetical protein
MTVREYIHRVWQKFEDGMPSDDARLRQRRVYSALLSARAFVLDKFIRQGNISEWNYTTLSCVPLEKTTAHECGCIPVQDCSYYKTSCELPDTMGQSNTTIKDVTTVDGTVQFGQTTWGGIKYDAYNRYTAKAPRYFIKNNRIFLVNVPYSDLRVITLRGVFSDPVRALQNCTQCPDSQAEPCLSLLDSQFPIESRFDAEIIQLAMAELQKVAEKDQVNDTRE